MLLQRIAAAPHVRVGVEELVEAAVDAEDEVHVYGRHGGEREGGRGGAEALVVIDLLQTGRTRLLVCRILE